MKNEHPATLQRAYALANAAFERGQTREAVELLDPAISAFASAEGERPALIKPLIRSADFIHRLESPDEAHRRLDHALAIARSSDSSPSLREADALCLIALVEWNNGCAENAATQYRAGIAAGEQAGATDQWLGHHLIGLADLLLDTEQQPDVALAYATRAVEVTERAEGADSRAAMYGRIALGRAQLAIGANAEAERTFEALLDARSREPREPATGSDKLALQLKDWLARARGG